MPPPIVEILVKPGKTLLIGYTVQNLGDPHSSFFGQNSNFFLLRVIMEKCISILELISPIRFSLDNTDMQFEQPLFMKTRDTVQALVRIRVPEGTPEGDYYFTVMAETEPAPQIGVELSNIGCKGKLLIQSLPTA